ncbi:MAG: hypothetical protein LC105_08940 [Chitinophagales bacterium]|nr:hypothetical protein [Chitinophagales bacterium]
MNISSIYQKWQNWIQPTCRFVVHLSDKILLFLGIMAMLGVLYDIGFDDTEDNIEVFKSYFLIYISACLVIGVIRVFFNIFYVNKPLRQKMIEFALLVLFAGGFELLTQRQNWKGIAFLYDRYHYYIYPLFFLAFIYSISKNIASFYSKKANASFLLFSTFFLLSGLGTVGLLLPNSTYEGIGFIDALLTSVSAVCTTGLTVVDTSGTFTSLGLWIILLLMQFGGLGVMTFAGILGRMFSSGVSFQQQMLLQDTIMGEKMSEKIDLGDKLSEVMGTIYKIVFVTLLVEGIGVFCLYLISLDYTFDSFGDRIFYSLFHSISSFCNVGMTLSSEGRIIETNHWYQLIISFLYIIGGIGFPIVFAFYSQIKNFINNIYNKIILKKHFSYPAHSFGVNPKLAIWTTFILTILSAIVIVIFEWGNTLTNDSIIERSVGVFFLATTPRGAGISIVDMGLVASPTALFFMLMMWIGASPASTGGGIKTTTFAIAFLNMWNIAKGNDTLVIFGKEVGQESMKRVYAVLSISIVLMGLFTFLVYSLDGELSLINIVFEVFSAFNNCGLSLIGTGAFSAESKIVLTIAMFGGRVGSLTLFTALLYKKDKKKLKYPSQEIIF